MNTVRQWASCHAVLLCLCLLEPLVFGNIFVFTLLCGVSILTFVFAHANTNAYFLGGPANWVTLARLMGLIALGLFYTHVNLVEIGIALSIIVVLDGLDGYLARRYKTESEFGTYFDMETDSFFVALASAILYLANLAPAWVLVAGFIRYPYGLLLVVLRWSTIPERRFYLAKITAVLFFVSLVAVCFVQTTITLWSLKVSAGLIFLSFSRSLYWIYVDSRDNANNFLKKESM